MNAEALRIVGRGMAFPGAVDGRGHVALVSGADSIEAALVIILSTRPGERVMRPAFGCRIWEFAFGDIDRNALGLVEHLAREAIAMWEPRVDVQAVRAESSPDAPALITVAIDFVVRSTNDRRNLVYPFYVIPE